MAEDKLGMGKRQKRFTGNAIASPELLGKEANVVLHNGQVYHVKILRFSTSTVICEDARRKSIELPLNDIFEIVLDLVSAY